MDNWDFNENVYDEGHYTEWNSKLGKNFTDNNGIHNTMMNMKNMESGGGYQATVSGMYGEFTIAAIFKSLPDEYAVLNDILIQTGIQLRKYNLASYVRYGKTPWLLGVKTDKNKVRIVDKEDAMTDILSGSHNEYYEIINKSSQIDHVIVSPYGMFVVETKNHKGWVFGDINNSTWTQVLNGENGRRAYGGHAHYTFLNPVRQNEMHMKHLSKYLNIYRNCMTGMIVFTNPEAYLGNVNCNCCYTLDMFAEAIFSYKNVLWNRSQVDKVIRSVEKLNSNSYHSSKEHIKYVQDIQYRHEINKMTGN